MSDDYITKELPRLRLRNNRLRAAASRVMKAGDLSEWVFNEAIGKLPHQAIGIYDDISDLLLDAGHLDRLIRERWTGFPMPDALVAALGEMKAAGDAISEMPENGDEWTA